MCQGQLCDERPWKEQNTTEMSFLSTVRTWSLPGVARLSPGKPRQHLQSKAELPSNQDEDSAGSVKEARNRPVSGTCHVPS